MNEQLKKLRELEHALEQLDKCTRRRANDRLTSFSIYFHDLETTVEIDVSKDLPRVFAALVVAANVSASSLKAEARGEYHDLKSFFEKDGNG